MLESPKRLVIEAVPVAAVLLFWNLLATVAREQHVAGAVGSAGVVMAALYVVVRGVSLSTAVIPPATGDTREVLYENALLALPAGSWFVAGMVTNALGELLFAYGPPSAFSALASSLAGAGLGVVGLYAVAAGYSALGGANDGGGGGALAGDGENPADSDEPATDSASGDD
ncbi:hypothetical protein [Halorussus aquaticus]|uniref:Uncharacterized protein n=1 Tax=Halorussus aquaticus TaxID=2953748 RepID=A0ABD5Q194_9EURY|nr:hypothetical protein [Halorussus aquaticus]